MADKTIIEKIAGILVSCIGLAGIIFLEFYFIEFSLFEDFPNIGIGFHLFGGFFVAIMLYYMFVDSLSKLEWPLVMIFIMGTVCLAAVGWEGFEWVLSHITGSPYQVSVDNTMEDLFVGLAGGLLACPLVLMRNVSFSKAHRVNNVRSI